MKHIIFVTLMLASSMAFAVNFSLNPSGLSHVPFSIDDQPSNWKIDSGSPFHFGSDSYADDWNLKDGLTAGIESASVCDRDRGAPIVSSLKGTVLHADVSGFVGSYGKEVVVRSSQNPKFAMRYSHLDTVSVNEGTVVNFGDRLGTVGDSGLGVGGCAHLHLVLYKNLDNETALNNIRNGRWPDYPASLSNGGPTRYAAAFASDATILSDFEVYEFWQKESDKTYFASCGESDKNIDAQFKIRNQTSARIYVNKLALAVHLDGVYLFDVGDVWDAEQYVEPGASLNLFKREAWIAEAGEYELVAKAYHSGAWHDLETDGFTVVENSQCPSSTELDAIRNGTHTLSWAYYQGDNGRWYISQNRSDADVYSLGPIKNNRPGWATVGKRVASVNGAAHTVSIDSDLDSDPSDTYYDAGWREDVTDSSIHSDRQGIQGKNVNVQWYFFYVPETDAWYIVTAPRFRTRVAKFAASGSDYDWQKIEVDDLVRSFNSGILTFD